MKRELYPDDVLFHIKQGTLFPYYLFYGENDFQKNFIIEKIEKELIPNELRELNLRIFYADELANSISFFIDFAMSFPFMSHKKLVIVKDIDKINNSALNKLFDYLKNPAEFTCVIFCSYRPNFKINFFSYIRKSGRAVVFRSFSESQTISWIKGIAKQMSMEIKDEACSYLYYIIGNNLNELYSEIQKLFSYYGKDAIIGINEIKSIVSYIKDYDIFDLIDSISSKNLSESLKILNGYIQREGKDKMLLILGMLIRQFNLIQKTKTIINMGGDIKTLHKELYPYSFLAKKLIFQSSLWSDEEIEKVFEQMYKIDMYLKSKISLIAGPTILEELIVSICS